MMCPPLPPPHPLSPLPLPRTASGAPSGHRFRPDFRQTTTGVSEGLGGLVLAD